MLRPDECAESTPVEAQDSERPLAGHGCRLVLRFARGDTPGSGLYNKFVASMVTNPVHVDAVLDRRGSSARRVCFTAYMKEKFSMTLMQKSMIYNEAYENLAVDLDPRDLERMQGYWGAMVDRTPYNYSDSMLLLPLIPHGGTVVDTMVQDVESGTDPAKISSVFCSQAVVLAIRECVRDTPALAPLVDELKKVNSRLCSPKDLRALFAPHATAVENSDLDF